MSHPPFDPWQQQKYGVQFWRNGSSKTGAQALAIADKNLNEIVIKSWMKNGQLWGCVTEDKFLSMLVDNKGLYEIITSYPHKGYFDIDKKGDNFTEEQFAEFIQHIKLMILQYFPNAEMAISGSWVPTKMSLHVVLNNYFIKSEEDRNIFKAIVNVLQAAESSFDCSVYTVNRCMKAVNQMKHDDDRLRIQRVIENDDIRAHCITCFFLTAESLPFPELLEEVKHVMKTERLKVKFDMTTLPKLDLRMPEEIDLATITPMQCLQLLPISKEYKFEYTHRVARFCKTHGIDVETFFAWITPKHVEKGNDLKVEYQRWSVNIWPKLDDFPPVSLDSICAILAHNYVDFKKDRHFAKFEKTFQLTDEVQVPKLEKKMFDVDKKFVVIKAGMGAGKTFVTIEYLTEHADKSLLWICPNRALVSNVHQRLIADGIQIGNYQDFPNKAEMAAADKLIICLNSLHHLQLASYQIIVIDEIETLLNKFVDNDFIKKTDKVIIWRVLLRTLNEADKVIFLDAFMTQKTMGFVKQVRGDVLLINCIQSPEIRTITFHHKEYQKLIAKMIADLKAGLTLFVFYCYKSNSGKYPSMEGLHAELERETGTRGKFINADKDDEELKELEDVNEHWKDVQFVITNNKITVGVNYDLRDFDKAYMFATSFNLPRDLCQVLARVRYLKDLSIDACYVGRMKEQASWKVDMELFQCPIYNSVIASVLVEFKSPLKETFQLFCSKAQYTILSDTSLLEKTVRKEIDGFLTKACVGYAYTEVDDIDDNEAQILNQKFMNQAATMLEKIQLQKYFFKKQFKPQAELATIVLKEGEIKGMVQYCWEEREMFLFKRFKEIFVDKDKNIFARLMRLNKKDNVFMPNLKDIQVSDDILADIFLTIKFKYLTESKSATIKVLKEAYNTYFKHELFVTKQQSSKSHNHIHEFPKCGEFQQKFAFAKAFLKTGEDELLIPKKKK